MRQPILGLKRLSHCLIVSPGVPAEIRIFSPPNWGLSHCLIVSPGSRQRSGVFPRPTGDCLIVSLSHRGPGRDPDFFPAQLGIVSLSHCLTGVPAEIRSFFPPNWGLSHCLIVSPGSRQRSGFFSRPTGDCLIVSLSHCLSWGSSAAFRIASHPEHRIQSIASHRIQSIGEHHRIASHRIASHRIQSIGEHRIASHRIASHRIASHRIQSIGGDTPLHSAGHLQGSLVGLGV